MMDLNEVAECVEKLNAALSEKGWRKPSCEYNFDGRHWFKVKADHPIDGGSDLWEFCGGEDCPHAAFNEAIALVRKQPSSEDAAMDDFRAALGKLIDKGNKLGIEADFLNPLTEQMRKLSTNIVTAQ